MRYIALEFIGSSNKFNSWAANAPLPVGGNNCPGGGKNIYSSYSFKFSDCTNVPVVADAAGELIYNQDFVGCPIHVALCSWHNTNEGATKGTAGTHSVPAVGCKMSKVFRIYGDMTINGEIGSYHELQSNRVDDQSAPAEWDHRHFMVHQPVGKLTLKYLKLTWGEAGNGDGGFIYVGNVGSELVINNIHFYGYATSGEYHAGNGGAIYNAGGIVTIKDSTFEGFDAKIGGAIYNSKNTMTIESTTFKNNWANVSFSF